MIPDHLRVAQSEAFRGDRAPREPDAARGVLVVAIPVEERVEEGHTIKGCLRGLESVPGIAVEGAAQDPTEMRVLDCEVGN